MGAMDQQVAAGFDDVWRQLRATNHAACEAALSGIVEVRTHAKPRGTPRRAPQALP